MKISRNVSAFLFTFAVVATGCGAQLSGSVSSKPADGGKTEVDVCLGVIAAASPEHLSATGLALVKSKPAPSSSPSAVATVLPSTMGRGAL